MVGPTIRPTFDVRIAGAREPVIERLRRQLVEGDHPVRTQNLGGHFLICPLERDVHFWSPWLDLDVGPHEGGTRVFGRFSPSPSIWTGFMCAYFSLTTLACFATIWGVTQVMLEERPYALWATLACVLVIGLLVWAAQIGQRLAQDQMAQMRALVFEVLEVAAPGAEAGTGKDDLQLFSSDLHSG